MNSLKTSWISASLVVLGSCTSAFAKQAECGAKVMPLDIYENASGISLAVGFGLVLAAILLDKKGLKLSLGISAVVPFL